MYDATGRLVSTPVNEMMNAGFHEKPIGTRDCRPGIYFLSMDADEYQSMKRFSIMH
jgi:hypothetical protein